LQHIGNIVMIFPSLESSKIFLHRSWVLLTHDIAFTNIIEGVIRFFLVIRAISTWGLWRTVRTREQTVQLLESLYVL
jgi:hypothetical protein